MASPNCKTEAENSNRYDEGITNRSSAVKFPRFTIIHTARVTMQTHEFSPGRALYLILDFHTISVPTPQQQNSNIHSIKKERKKYEQYLGGFLEWRHEIVKPKQRITIGCKPGPKTSSPIANKREHMHRILGPAIAPSAQDEDNGFLICHTQDATTKKMTNSMADLVPPRVSLKPSPVFAPSFRPPFLAVSCRVFCWTGHSVATFSYM